jgi:hypothetical protein
MACRRSLVVEFGGFNDRVHVRKRPFLPLPTRRSPCALHAGATHLTPCIANSCRLDRQISPTGGATLCSTPSTSALEIHRRAVSRRG